MNLLWATEGVPGFKRNQKETTRRGPSCATALMEGNVLGHPEKRDVHKAKIWLFRVPCELVLQECKGANKQ